MASMAGCLVNPWRTFDMGPSAAQNFRIKALNQVKILKRLAHRRRKRPLAVAGQYAKRAGAPFIQLHIQLCFIPDHVVDRKRQGSISDVLGLGNFRSTCSLSTQSAVKTLASKDAAGLAPSICATSRVAIDSWAKPARRTASGVQVFHWP